MAAGTSAGLEHDRSALDQLRGGRLWWRLPQLYLGLALYGWSMAMMIRGDLGLDPWDVFHQGVARLLPVSFGTVVIGTGALVLLLWWPLHQRPGLGTVSNVVVIGLVADAGLALMERPDWLGWRIVLLVSSVVLNGLAGALYIGSQFGPGPRDGLFLGLARRTGRSLRLMRTGVEIVVLLAGIALGGTFGVGTVLYALTIGPIVQFFLRFTVVPLRSRPPRVD